MTCGFWFPLVLGAASTLAVIFVCAVFFCNDCACEEAKRRIEHDDKVREVEEKIRARLADAKKAEEEDREARRKAAQKVADDWLAGLEPYSRRSGCAKCTSRKFTEKFDHGWISSMDAHFRESVRRICGNCGYVWSVRPADAEKK